MLRVVNFGSGKGGLATIGYTIYGIQGNIIAARSTAGVVEIGTGTGIYAADITLPGYDAIVLWDTGEATPRYSTEDYQHQITSIAECVEPIQKIYNSIKNQGEFFATLMDRMGLLVKNEGLQKVSDKVDELAKRDAVSLTNIEEAFNRAAGKITPTIPEIKMPDYSDSFTKLEDRIAAFQKDVFSLMEKAPEKQKEYTANFNSMVSTLNTMQSALAKNFGEQAKALREQVIKAQNIFARFDGLLSKINVLKDKVAALDVNDKEMVKAKQAIIAEIKIIKQMLDPVYQNRQANKKMILMSFGEKLHG